MKGKIRFAVTQQNGFIPIKGAKIVVTGMDDTRPLAELESDEDGMTQEIELEAPDIEYSLEPGDVKPYSEYKVFSTEQGYRELEVEGVEILADRAAVLKLEMEPEQQGELTEDVLIGPHTLYGDYPPKIPEPEYKEMDESGEIVLSRVVIPETIVVHDGAPSSNAKNYYVRYTDYIKNVASSEIYATWPESAIYANILCIMSFTLNRVYTEWYRNKGYDFQITSSTAYDQKWIYGRNTYANIDRIVDSIFNNYLSRPGVKQPIFTSYCDGVKADCLGLKQWGSKTLADKGYSAIEIIRYYYGNDMYINSSNVVSGIPSSFPGYNLAIGSSGEKVRQMQNQLNRIARNYPAITKVTPDGVFGKQTEQAVKDFQRIFGYPANGIVDYPTWYGISSIFVGVSRISEPGT